MVTANEELNALGHASSSSDIQMPEQEVANSQDQEDYPTLLKVRKLIKDRQQYYDSVDSISLKDNDLNVFSAEAQIEINRTVKFHLQEIDTLIAKAIEQVKETFNG